MFYKQKQRWTIVKFVTYHKEFSGVLITVIYPNRSATNANVKANSEITWLKRHVWSVLFSNYLSLKECALWSTTIHLLWLANKDRSVFKEVVYDQFSNSIVFKSWLYNWFFEIPVKSKHLFKLNKNILIHIVTFWFLLEYIIKCNCEKMVDIFATYWNLNLIMFSSATLLSCTVTFRKR